MGEVWSPFKTPLVCVQAVLRPASETASRNLAHVVSDSQQAGETSTDLLADERRTGIIASRDVCEDAEWVYVPRLHLGTLPGVCAA